MPYSVPPPPPLVVNLPSSEEVSSPIVAPPVISSTPEFSAAPVSSAAGAALHSCLSASARCRSSVAVESVHPTLAAERAAESVSQAEPLGQPLQVNAAIAQPEAVPVQYGVSSIAELEPSPSKEREPLRSQLANPQAYSPLLANRNRGQSRARLSELLDGLAQEAIAPPVSWGQAAAQPDPLRIAQASNPGSYGTDLPQSGSQAIPTPLTPAYPAS
ncbi:MAG TPA: hypothetical protein V6C57_08725, partial [Coleofasciculaceae cyanobacterium]